MPLARLVTRHPADAAGVAERLRAQGYTVEFVDPGDFVVSPADLEIRVDKLPRRQALARALEGDAPGDVYVAPRVLTPEALAAAAADVAAGIEGGEREGLMGRIRGWMNGRRQRRADEQALVREEALRQEEDERNARLEARVRREAEQRAAAEAQAKSQAARQEQERERAAAEEVERRRAEEVQRRRAEEQALVQAERQRVAALEAEQRRREEHEREEIERHRVVAAQRLRQQQEEEEYRQRAAEAAERRRQEDQAQRARSAALAEQRRQERELQNQRLAELEAQHRELQNLVAASRAAAERAPVAASVPRTAEPPQVLFTQRAAAAGAAARAHLDILRRQIPRPSVPPNQRRWAKAAVLAVAVSVALMLGWGAAANRQPASPLPFSKLVSSQNTTEQLPFTNATVRPATPAAKQAVPGQVAVPAAKAAPKPAASIPQSDPAPAPRRRSRPANTTVDDTVVIHHFSGSAGKAPQPLSANGVKRYSDSGN